MLQGGCFASPLYEARMRAPDLRIRVNLLAQAFWEPLCFSLSNQECCYRGLVAACRAVGSFLGLGASKTVLNLLLGSWEPGSGSWHMSP